MQRLFKWLYIPAFLLLSLAAKIVSGRCKGCITMKAGHVSMSGIFAPAFGL